MKRRYRKDLLSPTIKVYGSNNDVRDGTEVLLKNRTEAVEKGFKFYFTHRPCKNGHLTARYTSTHNCVECHREQMKERSKQQYQKWKELRESAKE